MVSAIGDHLGVTNAAVSQMLERLVQHGYVERLEDPEDRRARRISLTAKGKSVVRGSLEAGSQWLDGIAARLDPAERAGATRVLENLCALARVAEGPQSSAPTQ
jgi:DNA-binding MarR family transcriptional regulator